MASLWRRWATGKPSSVEEYRPVLVTQIDVTRPIPAIPASTGDRVPRYCRTLSYVRWGAAPMGSVMVDIPEGGLTGSQHAAKIWCRLEDQLRREASQIGIEQLEPLTQAGYATAEAAPGIAGGPHVTVIVATRDRPELLDRCLTALLAMSYRPFDVVVVDNAPSDDATSRLLSDRYGGEPRVSWVREDRPGLARAHNRGLRAATGSIVAFTDDDVVVDQEWLTYVVRAFRDPEVGCVTGTIYPIELETQAQWWLETYAGFSKGIEQQVFDLEAHRPDDVLFPYAAGKLGSGANMSFRLDALRRAGGFDESLGAGSGGYGGDDLSAFFEIVSRGSRLVYEPRAVVHHRHPASAAALRRQMFGYGAGLTAYLTKELLDRPTRVIELVAKAPRAVWYAFAKTSERNSGTAADFPPTLRLREVAGMAIGPTAYLRTRLKARFEDSAGGRS